MILIPFIDAPWFTETLQLENVSYDFTFHWNSVASFWTLSVYNRDTQQNVDGFIVLQSYDLFKQIVDRGLPPGSLIVVDITGNTSDIQQNDFTNGRLQLIYVETSDIVNVNATA